MQRIKRVLAMHDISCVGRCSLTVALPIISAAGIETSVLPTAVLSTHTGGFKNFTLHDLTSEMPKIDAHWRELGEEFDAIYTGFLCSREQMEITAELMDAHPEAMRIIDPVMGDNGQLYTIFDDDFVEGMTEFSSKADVISPNMTEAALLLKEKYTEGPYTKAQIEECLLKLHEKLGVKKIVLTGVYLDDRELGAACYDANSGNVEFALTENVEGTYHGTGDVFASVLSAAIVRGMNLTEAAHAAAVTTCEAIKITHAKATDPKYGVDFEIALPVMMRELGIIK